jgi:acetyl-CoA carboxylase carboxyltransferase component
LSDSQSAYTKDLLRRYAELREKALKGNIAYIPKLRSQNKLTARERLDLLLDKNSFIEDGLFANIHAEGLPADGVVTGVGTIDGRPVCVMANDPTVKAGSWGALTVEKIIRIQEKAMNMLCPIIYLVDSAGARITDQLEMFPGRRHAGRIFYNEVHLSGKVPQVCLLLGPSAAGGAYIPAFCDVVFMVRNNASMYLGSPRMAEMVTGEKVSLEEMGGAVMHCTISGCGDFLVENDQEAIDQAKVYLSFFPQNYSMLPPPTSARAPSLDNDQLESIIPPSPSQGYDMKKIIAAIVDKDSFFEIKKLYAREVITGLGRINGLPVGIIANQPMYKGGVLFVDSSDKVARFIWLCNAFNIPLVFLADVPGFMIGSSVERQGIIRHGAKLISAVAEARVPKISVIVRKAYGAGLYAMAGPAYDPAYTIALPTAEIAVMGPQPAVNAVFYNKLMEMDEELREAERKRLEEEYRQAIDIYKLADRLIVDDVVPLSDLRKTLEKRLSYLRQTQMPHSTPPHPVFPV